MGWSSGSTLGEEIYCLVRKYIPVKKRKLIASKIYDLLCDQDADDWEGTSKLEKDANINQDIEEE